MEQGSEEWLQWRKGKISGTRVKDLIVKRGDGRKIGFWEIIAERLSVDTSDVVDPIQRGHDLEVEAINNFAEVTDKEVNPDCGVWVSDFDDSIVASPDGEISDTEAVEVKCLGSARHLQAYFEKKIPTEYEDQTMQYFVVNENLETLYVIFYDPRIAALPIHWIEVRREDHAEKIGAYRQYQIDTLKQIDDLINQLTF